MTSVDVVLLAPSSAIALPPSLPLLPLLLPAPSPPPHTHTLLLPPSGIQLVSLVDEQVASDMAATLAAEVRHKGGGREGTLGQAIHRHGSQAPSCPPPPLSSCAPKVTLPLLPPPPPLPGAQPAQGGCPLHPAPPGVGLHLRPAQDHPVRPRLLPRMRGDHGMVRAGAAS